MPIRIYRFTQKRLTALSRLLWMLVVNRGTTTFEIVLYSYTVWWWWCLTFPPRAVLFIEWPPYLLLLRAANVRVWCSAIGALVAVGATAWFIDHTRLHRLWLLASAGIWTFTGCLFVASRQWQPNGLTALLIGLGAGLEYLRLGWLEHAERLIQSAGKAP